MKTHGLIRATYTLFGAILAFGLLLPVTVSAQPRTQCPGDTNGDSVIDTPDPGYPVATTKCIHLVAGDGYARMGDEKPLYIFSYADVTGIPDTEVMVEGLMAARYPAPTISITEGDDVFLNLTNVGMMVRPDLFDPHTIHFHGYPNASSVFDGVPDNSVSINMGATLSYYYKGPRPGTYMYHCHVEATEHMQMGMLGNLYVHPLQNGTPMLNDGRVYTKFAYNDGDGSTGYDVDFVMQMSGFDGPFHDASETVQPLPFAEMLDNYWMLNGRGYPHTIVPGAMPAMAENGGKVSQGISSLVTATAGERILLRVSNLNVTEFNTLTSLGIPMKVVGQDAVLLRGPTGLDLSYETNSLDLGGGQSFDVLLDTDGIDPGTYFLYTANLNQLSNADEDFGGAMTHIVIN
jgi:FtsP/CotA-like multicopper oxidase with cupredoxin domain